MTVCCMPHHVEVEACNTTQAASEATARLLRCKTNLMGVPGQCCLMCQAVLVLNS
jgi:hypothetical protein